jgi:putative membrane protein
LFTLVINALLIMLAATIVPGFAVQGFWWALLFGIVLAIVNFALSPLLKSSQPTKS